MTIFRTLALSFVLIPSIMFAQEKDLNDSKKPRLSEEEIRTGKVEFINASNLPATEQARKQSYDAGRKMAQDVVANGQATIDQVTVKRVYDPASPGFGADIITIDPKANFAHINAIQRIIAGYTQAAFEYTPADSETVSKFILYYNAKQRGALDKFKGKYSEPVIQSLSPETVGIDRSYRNWSGKTQIVIPLVKNVVRPGKQDINTTEIKKETDKTTKAEDKKQLTDIENRRKDETTKKLDQKQDQLKQEQKLLEDKKQDIQKQQQQVQQQKQDTGKKLQELAKDPIKNATEIKKEEQKQQDLKKQEDNLKKEEQKVTQQVNENKTSQAEVTQQKQDQNKTDTATNTATKTEDQKKVDTLQKENDELKKQQDAKEQKSDNVVGEKILFLRFVKFHSEGHYSNELWMLDPVKDDTLYKSPYTNICGREFVVVPGQGVLVIGYEGTAADSKEHLLALLDQDKLTLKTKSKENIYWRSPLILRDNKIYGIEVKDGQYYLTRFNPDLSFDARTSEPINADSDITFYNDKIYVTGKAQGTGATTIKAYQRSDLKHLKTITPPN